MNNKNPVLFQIFIITIFCLLLPFHSFSQTQHVYINGKVIAFSNNVIKIDSVKEPLYISGTARIVKHVKKQDSFYEERASLREINTGKSVTLKVTGNIVSEVIIEEYKK